MQAASTIPRLIAERAAESPDSVALSGVGRRPLTYARLSEHIQETAERLASLGIAGRSRVAVLHRNGPELATLFLAVASSATCAPLNPAYREPELDFYLSDLDAAALLIEAGLTSPAREVARRRGIPVVEIEPAGDAPAGLFAMRAPVATERSAAPESGDVALVLHTSGTTARPKLVPLTHGNLCASARNVSLSLSLSTDDRCLNVMPLFHIHGIVAGVLSSLTAGGCAICTPGFTAGRFHGWLDDLDPTWYTAVPTMHQAAVARADERRGRPRSRLRLVRSSSAPLPPALLAEIEQAFACPAIEAYGMTEAAHQIASNPLPPEERKPGSVGRPFGVEVAILDEGGSELPQGAIGEVALRGPGVFAGYEQNPDANRAAFAKDWFRTGDQGAFDEDGYLFLHGRLKEIINRGGEKVSPREVDEVLLGHPAVAQVVTFARPDGALGEEVAAAVVLEEGAAADEQAIQRFAAAHLADFKVPRTVVFLDQLPKGATGKVQRVGLAERLGLEPRALGVRVRPEYVAPRTPLEGQLAAQWSELLGVARVGTRDDFFDLGGDSLAVAALFAWIDETGLVRTSPSVSTLLWAPTLESLAAALEEGNKPTLSGSLVAIDPKGAEAPSEAPFFFAPGHDGSVVMFVSLARRLHSRHPFYAIGARANNSDAGEVTSVEELACRYAEEIRKLQPTGPYYLGGRCMGGGIALEMARQLMASGERVELLALLDPIGEARVGFLRDRWRRFKFHRKRHQALRMLRRLSSYRRRRTRWTEHIAREHPLEREMRRAGRRYVARPYGGEITLLRGAYYLTPVSFWERRAAGGLRVYPPIDGDISKPPWIDVLADQMSDALRGGD